MIEDKKPNRKSYWQNFMQMALKVILLISKMSKNTHIQLCLLYLNYVEVEQSANGFDYASAYVDKREENLKVGY